MKESEFQLVFDVIKQYCEKQDSNSGLSQSSWKYCKEDLVDDQDYLVSYLMSDNTYSRPFLAYWSESEGNFFSLEYPNSPPILADIFMEIPEFPE